MAASTPTSDWIAPVARRLSTPAEAYAFSTRRVTGLLNRRLQRLRSHGRLAAGGCSAPAPAQRKQGKARERGAVDGVRTQRAVPLEKGDHEIEVRFLAQQENAVFEFYWKSAGGRRSDWRFRRRRRAPSIEQFSDRRHQQHGYVD